MAPEITAALMRFVPGPQMPRIPPVPNAISLWKASVKTSSLFSDNHIPTVSLVSLSYGALDQTSALLFTRSSSLPTHIFKDSFHVRFSRFNNVRNCFPPRCELAGLTACVGYSEVVIPTTSTSMSNSSNIALAKEAQHVTPSSLKCNIPLVTSPPLRTSIRKASDKDPAYVGVPL